MEDAVTDEASRFSIHTTTTCEIPDAVGAGVGGDFGRDVAAGIGD
jgi:hypothetical protein